MIFTNSRQLMYLLKGLVHPKILILSVIFLRFNKKYLNLCYKDERKSYRFGTT